MTVTLDQFIADHKIGFTCESVRTRPDRLMSDLPRHFRCTLAIDRRRMTVYFSQGSAHTSDPTLADVLDCLASDAAGQEDVADFESWANEYGFDTDSRSAENMYASIVSQAAKLKNLLADNSAYLELLYSVERQ